MTAATFLLRPIVVLGFLLHPLADATWAQSQPDKIYFNGTVITMDAANHIAEAVAVKGDKIIAVGGNDDIRAMAGAATESHDLAGNVLLPGFYDCHSHFPGAGRTRYSVNLNSPPMGPIEKMSDLIEALRKKAQETPKGGWVSGRGYDDTLLKEKRHPTRHDLDKASTEHPIYIRHTSGHLGVANILALRLAEVTKDTPQPAGGRIRMDPETGEPNGIFEESGRLVSRLIPPLSREQQLQAVKWAVDIYAAQGITTVVIAGGGKESIGLLSEAAGRGMLPLRVISMVSGRSAYEEADSLPGVTGTVDGGIKIGAVKLFQDGSNQGYTGYFSKPYHVPFHGDGDYRGYPRQSREKLTEMVKKFHRAGHQIAIHGNGDAAIDDILYAIREAQKEFPRKDTRHRIEHCQLTREEQLDEIKELGISPSFFVAHVYYWGDRHRDIFMGPERASRISALRDAVERDIRFTLHNDTPVTPINPRHLIWCAVNRLTRSNRVLGPNQRITTLEALRAVTADAAWQNFEEDIKGAIEPGKLADLVILGEDPLKVDPLRIKDIPVLETIVGGRTVYKK
jgi:predicted amidohydrolase YtcJ